MDKIIVRSANVNDAKSIASVHMESINYTYKGLLPFEIINKKSLEQRIENWQRIIESGNSTTIIAAINDSIVGFSNLSPARTEGIDPTTTGELNTIYIHPDHLNKGLGKAIWNEQLKHVKENKYQEIITWVLNSNSNAHRFYKRVGFTRSENERVEEINDLKIVDIQYVYKVLYS